MDDDDGRVGRLRDAQQTRLLMPASGMSVILCAAALAARPTLAEILFYAGGACIALGIGAAADFDP